FCNWACWEAEERARTVGDGCVRVVLKYRHCDGNLCIKVTDDVACLLYRTDQAQDVKKIEKFHSQLMRLMVAKESRSAAMETD
uniref:Signal recognition particle 9 kDa protein n=1 Tax=Cyanistes caeruleus TaxID=156563 RepID=A0A8C0V120_CYACU